MTEMEKSFGNLCVVVALMALHFNIMPICNPPKCNIVYRLCSECLSFEDRQAKYPSLELKLSLKYTSLNGLEILKSQKDKWSQPCL